MYQCPNCELYVLEKKKVHNLSFSRSITCPECNAVSSKPYWSVIFKLLEVFFLSFIYKLFKGQFFTFLIIVISTAVALSYLEKYITPLKLKRRKDQIYRLREQYFHYTKVAFAYVMMFLIVIYSVDHDPNFVSKDRLLTGMNQIYESAESFNEKILNEGGYENIDADHLNTYLNNFKFDIVEPYYKSFRVNFEYQLIDSAYFETIDHLIDDYENNDYSYESRMRIKAYMKKVLESKFITDKSTYPLSINIFKLIEIPEDVNQVFKSLSEI